MIRARPYPFRRLCLAAGLLSLLAMTPFVGGELGAAPADASTLHPAGAALVSARLAVERKAVRALRACPADLFEKGTGMRPQRGSSREFTVSECAAKPGECYSACTLRNNEKACFRLAQAYEQRGTRADALRKQTLFALACAAGDGAGCTNRAAGLRNGAYRGDPLLRRPEAERRACEHRSFKIDCDRDGAWGCAMLGQSYRLGEGVPASRALARQAYEKACRLSPNFAACEFAKSDLAEMGAAAH